MNEFTKAQVIEHTQFILREVKPCSVLLIKNVDADYALSLVKEQNIKAFICETDDKNWCNIWIYKRNEMREVIKNLPEEPVTEIDHFLLGCIFGYSINAILDFIGNLNKNKS